MLTTTLILPHPSLNDFISNYSLCTSGTANLNMSLPWFAHHDTSLCFFLGDTPVQIRNTNIDNPTESTNKVCLCGLMTHCKGTTTFKGNYKTFIIEFKLNGFNKMFGIPASKICNNTYPAIEVIGNEVKDIYEHLLNASNVKEMVWVADRFLMNFLSRQKATYKNEGITKIAHQLLSNNNTTTIPHYATYANMSIRNFERRFSEQVGTSPKLFCKLIRFNRAINCKLIDPKKSWTDIAYECGYYDGMHMVKEFKQFSNASPAALFNNNSWLINETVTILERTTLY